MNSTNCPKTRPSESSTDSNDRLSRIWCVLSMTGLVLIAVAVPVCLWIDSLHQETTYLGRATIIDLFHEPSTIMMHPLATRDSPGFPVQIPESWTISVQLGDRARSVTVPESEWYHLRRGETVDLFETRGFISSRVHLQPTRLLPENTGN